ncbi:MarR family winged helix-turn-helix transcriptional regulator [Aurantimonas endophytica]|uniref:DNA-binding MarR family transcriptional regulator n=1 Tax=Aurantimonas endophytica TaxID=1522175 RepID=A0A7W6MR56_9HYPH|nr:MarR family winged helix-turn-helix transcriptional regulator [Aurantimonas endophytica]MBB4004685.1 DNA-binding MarR family transcriptional regulator [Aurantimonas endophytica]MCO6405504.1 MarR family transcriptional regulator [Aurantimonas endophytica]
MPKIKNPSTTQLLPKIFAINRSIRGLMGLKLAEIGLYPGQDELLLALSPETGTNVSRLADSLRIRPSTVSKMVRYLAAQGLVERAGDPHDARLTFICITPSGTEMQRRIKEVWQSIEQGFREMDDRNRVERDLRLIEEFLRKPRSSS